MTYATPSDFIETKTAAAQPLARLTSWLTQAMIAARRPRFDPTKLSARERAEAGILECEVDWHNAAHAPLIGYVGR